MKPGTEGGGQPRRLSEEIAQLRKAGAQAPVTLGELVQTLRSRGYIFLILLLSLPFVTPIPLPGLSTPLGLVIVLLALRLVLGGEPWLPRSVLARQIPAGFLDKVGAATERGLRFAERFLRPRWDFLFSFPGALRVHALLLTLAGLVLLLPLPIPFTNSFPAWVLLFGAIAWIERDGLFMAFAYLCAVLGALYFIFLGEAARRLLHSLAKALV